MTGKEGPLVPFGIETIAIEDLPKELLLEAGVYLCNACQGAEGDEEGGSAEFPVIGVMLAQCVCSLHPDNEAKDFTRVSDLELPRIDIDEMIQRLRSKRVNAVIFPSGQDPSESN